MVCLWPHDGSSDICPCVCPVKSWWGIEKHTAQTSSWFQRKAFFSLILIVDNSVSLPCLERCFQAAGKVSDHRFAFRHTCTQCYYFCNHKKLPGFRSSSSFFAKMLGMTKEVLLYLWKPDQLTYVKWLAEGLTYRNSESMGSFCK